MKALAFYISCCLSFILICSEITVSWSILCLANIILIVWCRHNITFRELIRYSGYKYLYRILQHK